MDHHQWELTKAAIIEAYEGHAATNFNSPDAPLATQARIAVREVERFQTNYRAAYNERAQLRTELAQVAAEREALAGEVERLSVLDAGHMEEIHGLDQRVNDMDREHGRLTAERDAALAALTGLAMRSFTSDGSLCWCDGPVLDPTTWRHEPECIQAREAMGYGTRLEESRK